MSLLQSVATTEVINVVSSAVATAVFLSRGVVNVKLGTILGVAMFCGAMLAGRAYRFATKFDLATADIYRGGCGPCDTDVITLGCLGWLFPSDVAIGH